MNENTHKTEPLTEDQLRALGIELKDMGEALMKAADAAAAEPEGVLQIYNWPSALLGRKKLKGFVDDAREAAQLARIGDSRRSGTPKPRSRAKDKIQQMHDAAQKGPPVGTYQMEEKKPRKSKKDDQ